MFLHWFVQTDCLSLQKFPRLWLRFAGIFVQFMFSSVSEWSSLRTPALQLSRRVYLSSIFVYNKKSISTTTIKLKYSLHGSAAGNYIWAAFQYHNLLLYNIFINKTLNNLHVRHFGHFIYGSMKKVPKETLLVTNQCTDPTSLQISNESIFFLNSVKWTWGQFGKENWIPLFSVLPIGFCRSVICAQLRLQRPSKKPATPLK